MLYSNNDYYDGIRLTILNDNMNSVNITNYNKNIKNIKNKIYIDNGLEMGVEFHGFQWMPDIFFSDGVNRGHLSVNKSLSEKRLIIESHIVLVVNFPKK